MRPSSSGRRSSSNPVRVSMLESEEKGAGRSDARRTHQISKSKGPTQVDSSQIPRPKIRSSSSERASIRRSNLKPPGRTPAHPVRISNAATPLHTGSVSRISSGRAHLELPSGTRHRSPSAERASGFGAKGPRKDNRQLADKVYQGLMLLKIDRYFYEIQQTSLLNSNASLKPITLKIFVEATNCLIKLLDIKQDLTIANYMDELPKIAKKLRYPGIVTKSWLKTANTMHSWPQVLGWLSWLCEVCEAKDKAELAFDIDKIPFLGNNDEEETQKETFLAILNIYKAWNDEKLEEEAALVEKRVREMCEQYGDIGRAIQEEELLFDEEKASINIGDQQEAELDEHVIKKLKEIVESLKRDENQEMDSINFAQECVKRATLEKKQLNLECDTLEDQIEKDSLEQNKLINIVENQKMTVEKRDEIIKQCSEIENHIRQFDNYIKDIENELYALDLKFANSNQNLYRAILAYNKDIVMHVSCDTGVDPETLKMPESNLLSPDFMNTLKIKEAATLSLKENMRKQLSQTESAIHANSNELDSLTNKLKALQKENNDYVAKVHERRLCVQQIQHQTKNAEAKLKVQIKHLVNDIEELQRSMPDIEAAANELAEAQDKFQAVLRRSEYVKTRMERFFDRFYDIVSRHRNDIDIILKKLPKP